MKFIHFRLLIMLSIVYSCFSKEEINSLSKEELTYILKLKFPKHIEKLPKITGNYKGYRIEFENELCLITQNKVCNQFILVITQDLKPKIEGKSLKYFERIENKPCRLFYLTNCSENQKTNWIIEEEKQSNLPLRIPEEAIIVLMNANYVESINPINLNFDAVHYLSEIIIKNDISQQELDLESIYSAFASMDPNAFSTSRKKKLREENGVVISKIDSHSI